MLETFSVKKPMTILVGVILILGMGALLFPKLKTDLLPSMELPYVIVATTYPGASPEKVEQTVTKPVESILSTVSGLAGITSTSSENSSMVMLEFSYETNMDSAILEVNSQLDMIESSLEEGVVPPMVIKVNPDMLPIMILGASIDNTTMTELSTALNQDILPALERVQGVGSVTASGLVEEQLQIVLNHNKIQDINDQLLGSLNSELSKASDQIAAGEAQLAQMKAEMDKAIQEQQAGLTTAQKDLVDKIAQIDTGLTKLEEGKALLQSELISATKQKALAQFAIDEVIKAGGTPTKEMLALLEQLKMSVEMLTAQVTALDAQILPLKNTKVELEKALVDLGGGKDALNMGYITMRSEIALQESLLKNQKASFEAEKDKALASANLDGLLNAEMISSVLMAQNFSMPAGYISDGDMDFSLKIGDAFSNVEEINRLVLMDTGDVHVTLSEVADVSLVEKREDVYAKINGQDAITLSLQKQSNAATAEVSKALHTEMDKLTTNTSGLHLTPLMDQGIYIDLIIGSVLQNLILGGAFAILILFAFLRDFKPTLVVAFSIPISVLFAIILMYFSGVDLNMISLSGLALGIGMLLDNSIVVIENIFRLRSEGISSIKAAVAGTKEVAGAITASTLTTICVYMPILFTEGISRQLFMDMGLTIAYSLLASLLVALTLVPSLSATLLKKELKPSGNFQAKVIAHYRRSLDWVLRKKVWVLLLSLALLIVSIVMAASTGIIFIPEGDSTEISVTIEPEVDATLAESREIGDQLMDEILTIPDVEFVGAMQGGMLSMSGGQSKTLNLYLMLKEDKQSTSQEIGSQVKTMTEKYPVKATITTSSMNMSALSGSGIQVQIKGNDLETLLEISENVKTKVSSIAGVESATNGQEEASTEKRIVVYKDRATKHNLTVAQIYQEISKALKDQKDATILTMDSKDVQVVVIKDPEDVLTYEKLSNHIIEVDGMNGKEEVRLGDIASFEDAQGLSSVTHDDLTRIMTVGITIKEGYNVSLVGRDVEASLKDFPLPDGYSFDFGGETETINQTMGDLLLMAGVAIVFVYLIMVAQFQTLLSPFIVMFTMPLAFTGGFFGLVLTGNEISTIAMLGFIMLSGVVVNNGIVFVDYTNRLRADGMDKRTALLTAGARRLRPIAMTTLTTVLGLITLALGMGTGSDILSPMAIVVIGGLLYATLMTLYVVPIMYELLYRKEVRILGDEDLVIE